MEFLLDNGTKEYLATNIFDPASTQSMFRELYDTVEFQNVSGIKIRKFSSELNVQSNLHLLKNLPDYHIPDFYKHLFSS